MVRGERGGGVLYSPFVGPRFVRRGTFGMQD